MVDLLSIHIGINSDAIRKLARDPKRTSSRNGVPSWRVSGESGPQLARARARLAAGSAREDLHHASGQHNAQANRPGTSSYLALAAISLRVSASQHKPRHAPHASTPHASTAWPTRATRHAPRATRHAPRATRHASGSHPCWGGMAWGCSYLTNDTRDEILSAMRAPPGSVISDIRISSGNGGITRNAM